MARDDRRTRNVRPERSPSVETASAWSDDPARFVLTFETDRETVHVHISLFQLSWLARELWKAWRKYRETVNDRLNFIEDRLHGEDR